MKNMMPAFALSGLLFFLVSLSSYGVSVPMPDTALEAAIEAKIGDNGISGTVDRDWLSGQEGDAGPYTGAAGGLTVLGMEGDAFFTLMGVRDLTGLEYAHNLSMLFLEESPVPSLAPITHLKALTALAFNSCGLNDAHVQEFLEAEFSLTTFILANEADSKALENRISENQLLLLIERHPVLQRLALVNMGLALEPVLLAGAPLLADPPCRKELYLSGNQIVSLEKMSLLYDARHLEMARCGITDTILAQTDGARLACLDTMLDLSENAITTIEPLRDLLAVQEGKAPVTVDLRGNRLDEMSINEHIPALKQAGYDVLFDMELLLEVEGIGDLPPTAGSSWHPFGASVLRIARPRPDSNQGFVGWHGDVVTDEYGATAEMTRHRRLTAVFSETPAPGRIFYPLVVATSGTGRGSLLPLPGKSLYRDGETVGLAAAPEPGSYFGGWHIVYNDVDKNDVKREHIAFEPSQAVEMNGAVTATARFDTTGHMLTLDLSGKGILSLSPGSYPISHEAVIVLLPLPEPGWRLGRWEDGHGNVLYAPEGDADPSYTLTLVEDSIVRAVFEEAVRTLTINLETTRDATGTTMPSGDFAGQEHSYAYGDLATITALPGGSDSAFAGWSGDLPENMARTQVLAPELTLPMTRERKITVAFVPAETRLVLDATLDGAPYDVPPDFVTPASGAYGFVRDPDNQVVLRTHLLPGVPVAFAGWAGDLSEKTWSSSFTETVPMDRDRTITAAFQTQDTCKLTVVKQGNGSISPMPGVYAITPGQHLLFNATAQGQDCFGGWRVHCQSGSDLALISPELSLDINGDTEVKACFGDAQHTLWIGATQESGELTPSRGVYRVPDQTVIDLRATPPEGSMFYHWSNSDGAVFSHEPHVRITVVEESRFNAVFGPPGYRVKTKAGGTGSGSVTVLPEMEGVRPANSMVELRATPEPDFVFVRWEGILPAGMDVTQPTATIALTQDVDATAVFDEADYRITVIAEGLLEGQVAQMTPAPGVYGYLDGTEATLFAAPPPDSGIAFASWERDGDHTITPEVKFVMDRDSEVIARFVSAETIDSVMVDVMPSEGDGEGILKPLMPGAYHFSRNAAITFSCDLQTDSYFGGFVGDVEGEINYHELRVVLKGDMKIGARFAHAGAILNLGLNGEQGGTIYPLPGSYRLSHDVDIVLTAARTNTQWVFRGWYDGFESLLSPYGRHRFRMPAGITEMTIIGAFHKHTETTTPLEYCWLR